LTPVLLDTGVIVALLDRSERYHLSCKERLDTLAAPLVTCEAVIAESCYLLRHLPGAVEQILKNVESGAFQIPFRLSGAASQLRRIFRRYSDREVDLADACLVHLAEEMGTGDILTLDRDFEVYRWGSRKRFRMLIPLQ
jgi:predicted nucleic acid-binding protein